jgi:hypothetical protein
MRTTLNIDEDALLAARHLAQRERLSLGEAASRLIRQGAMSVDPAFNHAEGVPLRGRFALLPARDEVLTPAQVRQLMDREGI